VVLSVLVTITVLSLADSRDLLASNRSATNNAPAYISHQGFLSDSDPLAAGVYTMRFGVYTAVAGGSPVWQETHASVPVSQGYFAVMLGAGACAVGCPLGPDAFSGAVRYLETSVDTGGGFVNFPRQPLGYVPYAFQAASVPWSGVTNPPSFGNYENVIVVAKSGGDFTSVAAALNSISDASENNRYLVRVAPGIYAEDNLVEIAGYVHLQGDGPATTIITSNRGSGSPNQNAATLYMEENSYLSNLGVRNTGAGPISFGVYIATASRNTVIDNVDVVVDGAGTGGDRSGIHLNSAAPTIKNSSFKASGATGFGTAVNAGLSSVHTAGGGFPQALILNSIFLGGPNSTVQSCNDNSGTGFGMQLNQATPDIRHSYICGGYRGVALLQNGHPRIQGSELRVSGNSDAYLFEISAAGSISIAHSTLTYFDKLTGTGTGLRCVHNHDWGSWLPLSNGTTAATTCNK
jgi:hypothetical protein